MHFDIPAVGELAHSKLQQRVATDGPESAHVGVAHAVKEPHPPAGQNTRRELVPGDASRLAFAACARSDDEIEAAGHPQPVVIPFNLETALPHQYDELAAMIEKEFGHLDGLLHNASIIGPRTPIEQLSGENFMRVMHVNVNAMFMLTSTLLPLLKLSQDASVVFTSSSVGRKGRAYWGAYGVSKFATEGLMQTLADELEDVAAVRSNSINPGGTRTSMRAQAYPGENPMERPAPEEIMPVYLYLMGPDSAGINGQAFDAQ